MSGTIGTAVFPTFAGQTFGHTKTPSWATRRVRSTSGRDVRAQLYQYPIWNFEVAFEVLSDTSAASAVGAQTLQNLISFYNVIQQSAGVFLFNDPTDNFALNQGLAAGTGTQTIFTLTRTVGGSGNFTEPVGQVNPTGLVIEVNGVVQPPTAFSVRLPNQITFVTAPPLGATVIGTYNYYFLCEFLDDAPPFKYFSQGLWSLTVLKFCSVKP